MFQEYINELHSKYKTGDAVERSYYPSLQNLLERFRDTQVLIEAKNSIVGIPDFKVDTPKNLLVGYIEAKDLGRDLDKLSGIEQEQLKKYLEAYPKLILTNFIEFRLYEEGQKVDNVIISYTKALEVSPSIQNEGKFESLLERFFSTTIPKIYTSKKLAELLAHKTHVLRNLILEEINLEDNVTTNTEELFYSFRKTLQPQMTVEEFADIYAQTVTFGLFTARVNSNGEEFNRRTSYDLIPHTVPLLKRLFWIISGQEVPQHIKWQADELAEILANADILKIKEDFFSEGKGRDPIIHFYETFLAEYDPKEREKRGVYYTPLPVVTYIASSVHKLLKDKFNKSDGFADTSVLVLDPAAGTLTFPAEAISLAKTEYTNKYGEGSWISLVKNHILKNYYAFELLMAPYAIGHLKISLLLQELGYKLKEDDRFKLYLTNTLEMEKLEEQELFMAKEIAEESEKAYEVKQKTPILVIMGNPPYSVSSSNVIKEGSDFYNFYESYKERVRKEERNIQPLSDDYIKFIAFAHWKINQTDKGIVGMITNNSYLDGLIHRDMRRRLLEDFNEIYVLNLHGNAKRQEKSPDGGKDENVFDIQQGVSIILLIKDGSNRRRISYADLWGSREDKYKFLENKNVDNTDWKEILPKEPQNFFVLKNFDEIESYTKYFSLEEIFIKHNAGVATGKDDFLTDFSDEGLVRKLSIRDKFAFDVLMRNYKVEINLAEKWYTELKSVDLEKYIKRYSYRPFDVRSVFYNHRVLQRAREIIMNSFLESNLGLVTTKQLSTQTFSHSFVTDTISDRCLISLQTREVSYVFPVYIYKDGETQNGLFSHTTGDRKQVNYQQPFLDFIDKNLISPAPAKRKISYEEILYYIYTVLYSNVYRQKYREFLKIDFPKIPFTKDFELFKKIAGIGKNLVDLHLLKSSELDNPIVKFYGKNSNYVEKREYIPVGKPKIQSGPIIPNEFQKTGMVYINRDQAFAGINSDVWNYYIGGYQVLDKWLKDRKGKSLSPDDIKHYCKVVTAISKTIEIQKQIDMLYPEVEQSI